MKTNMPVTDTEVEMKDNSILVSQTNLEGIITYCNQDFIEISGYNEDELLGKEHNIVRHPDMPAVAFADLWNTLEKQKTWTGIVKNRCKNGDFYWVKANVTQLKQDGQVTGYMSVRSKATLDEVACAEALYTKLNSGEASLEPTRWQKLNVLNRMSIGNKLRLTGFAFMLPIVALLILLFLEKSEEIDLATTEITGIEYIEPLRQLISHIAVHRGMTNALLNGNESFNNKLPAIREKIAKDIQLINKVDVRLGEPLNTSKYWQTIKSDWSLLGEKALDLRTKKSFTLHSDLIKKIITLVSHVGKTSKLLMTSDIDTYNLNNILVLEIPAFINNIGILRGMGAGIVESGKYTEKQQATILNLYIILKNQIGVIIRFAEAAFAHNAELELLLGAQLKEFTQFSSNFLIDVEAIFLRGEAEFSSALDSDVAAFFNKGNTTINKTENLFNETSNQLTNLLNQRISDFRFVMISKIGIALLISMLAFVLSLLVTRSITSNTRKVLNVFSSIGEGKFDNEIEITTQDEQGRLLDELKALQKIGRAHV